MNVILDKVFKLLRNMTKFSARCCPKFTRFLSLDTRLRASWKVGPTHLREEGWKVGLNHFVLTRTGGFCFIFTKISTVLLISICWSTPGILCTVFLPFCQSIPHTGQLFIPSLHPLRLHT